MSDHSPDGGSASYWCRTSGGLALFADPADSRPLMEAGKPVAVLVYLGLAPGGRAQRDHVAELIWPGSDLTEARHSLRQALYRLRHVAGGPLVHLHGSDLEISLAVRFDCVEGERAAAGGDPERAALLLRGSFLDGFALPESREFESWAEAQRIRFRDVWAGAARTLAERALRAGDPRAVELAEQLATLRPFNDEPTHLVMAALAAAGRHAAAVARYHAYVELLRRELEGEPGKELTAYARELEGYVRARPEPSVAALPFVGRASQWATLDGAWQAARGGRGATILLEGGAGLGKSRVIAELTTRVGAAGGVTLVGKCYDIERAVPYAAVADALALLAKRSEIAGLSPALLAEATRLLPELHERFPGVPSGDDGGGSPAAKRRLHQAVARSVEVVAEGAPVLLAVDDVHWADGPSLEILHFLSHRLVGARVLLVMAYRPAELSPLARQFARSICSSRLANLLVLEPLTLADVANMLGALGRFDDPATGAALAHHLQRHTAGNPLFLNEMLGALARNRVLVVRDGRWQLSAASGIAELPRTLGKLMADRVDGLTPWMRACLETLAVAASETSVELLAEALEASEPRAELALAVLEEERLVRRAAVDTFELVHDELRRLVYQGIADERRRLLHAAVGSALESRGEAKRPGGAARLAFHFDQASLQEPAHRYALAAAGEAEALAAPVEQRAHLELVEAHAPKALPPVARVEPRGLWGLVRRHGLVALGAAVLALGSAAVGLLYGPLLSGGPGYRQATIYLRSGNTSNPTHRVRWPVRRGQLGKVEPVRAVPGAPPALVTRPVTASNETHNKVFAIRGRDTVQITFGLSDDAGPEWAPDGSRFLFVRGWKASETRYQQNIFLADSTGTVARSLTDSHWQDQYAVWSPSGSQFAFARDSATVWSVWVADGDGTHSRNITAELGLPTVEGLPSFAPDERRLAVVYPNVGSGLGAIYVVDLVVATATPLRGILTELDSRALWSPDGEWLMCVTQRGSEQRLWVVSTGEPTSPVLVAESSVEIAPHDWSFGRRRSVESVGIESTEVRLRAGQGLRVTATVLGPDAEPMPSIVRWSVADTSVARVDDLGFVRGRGAGTTQLVASAGGIRADTATVTVSAAAADTLFDEDWTSGLDTTRWIPFGFPRPVVAHGLPPDGRSAFFNNGDYNHGSGAVSVQTFEVGDAGLTLETEAWLPFTGQHWQNWSVGLASDPLAGGPTEVVTGSGAAVHGPEPTLPGPRWVCHGGQWSDQVPNRRGYWRRIAIVVRPDAQIECWVDGRLLDSRSWPGGEAARPLAMVLRGMSVGTRLYHGRVVVTRGLRY